MRTISLNGKWTMQSARADVCGPIAAQVPGDTHSALLAARRIPDPYRGMNEWDVQWVGREDWAYTRTLNVPADMLAEKSVFLNCDGLDSVTSIFVNGRRAARTDNMFRRYRVEVKRLLQPGRNEIRIVFHSAERAAIAAARDLPYPIPTGGAPVFSPHRNLIRKVQCHSGWDWGICLMVAGVAGDIYLGATSLGRIEYVTTVQRHSRNACAVDVTCEVLSPAGGRTQLDVQLGKERVVSAVTLQPGLNVLRSRVQIRNPRLWWPNGCGDQPLYDLTVRVAGDVNRKRLGLRALEVVNQKDAKGLSMFFRINGVDVFCKGANWIPCDALPQRQTPEALDDLLTSAANAHMNMLRVWGGGQYESDAFYRLCDEKGILIWHDFMFACSLYPATPEFLDNVREEVRHQVKRLRDHACIALWCGNNENIGAMNWFEESRKSRDRYLVDYDRLNEGTVGKAVDECDPTRTFWPSSPCGGRGDYSDAFHKDNRGDMHYWSVWHEGKSFDAFHSVIPRFCSEFGYQSFPSLDTIRTYAPPEQFNVTAPVMEWHQRNVGGNSKITEMFTRYFRIPEGFANFVYLSQVQQGLAIKTAVEHWRHLRPTCMGTLYWQLNDNWPVCSWSSLEYRGKWKLLHHMARRFYAPLVTVTFQTKGGDVEVWAVNDTRRRASATVTVRVMDFRGRSLRRVALRAALPAGSARLLRKFKLAELTDQPDTSFMALSLRSGRTTFQNEHFFCEWKKCDLAAPRIRMSASARREDGFTVKLTTDRPAFYVALNADGIRGEFDDNAFTLLPDEPRALVFAPKQKVTLRQFQAALSLNHLRATYR